MPGFMLFIVIVVVVLLLLKSVHDAQQGKSSGGASPSPPEPQPRARPRPRPRPRRKAKPIDEDKLADHVGKLREAVEGGLITTDEAVASIVRFTEGGLSEDAARQLLHQRDAA